MKNKKRKSDKLAAFIIIILLILLAAWLSYFFIGLYDDYLIECEKQNYPKYYTDSVEKYSAEYNIPEYIVYAVIKTESDFVRTAESSAGAVGLMQIMPSTFDWVMFRLGTEGDYDDLYESDVNIMCGCYLLSFLYEDLGYSWDNAFAAYNAGRGRVQEWLADESISQNGVLVNIPSDGVKQYIEKINRIAEKYFELYYSENEE